MGLYNRTNFAVGAAANTAPFNTEYTKIANAVNSLDNANIGTALTGAVLNLTAPGAIGGVTPSTGAFTTLTATSAIITTITGNGALLTNLTAANLVGALPAISGALLTNLNADNLAGGTVPDARFPATLPAVSGVNLTALNATQLTSGIVPLARLSGITNTQIAAGAAIASSKLDLTVIHQQVIIDTDSGSESFYVSRLGSTTQTAKMYVTDNDFIVESIQDEVGNGGFIFIGNSDGSGAIKDAAVMDAKFYNCKVRAYNNALDKSIRISADASYAYLYTDTAPMIIRNGLSNADIYFQINDGGVSNRTLIQLDASTSEVLFKRDAGIKIGAGADGYLYIGSNNLYIANQTSNENIIFRINDGGVNKDVAFIDGASATFNIKNGYEFRCLSAGNDKTLYFKHNDTNGIIGTTSGSLILDPQSDQVLPISNGGVDIGSSTVRFDDGYFNKLHYLTSLANNDLSFTETWCAVCGKEFKDNDTIVMKVKNIEAVKKEKGNYYGKMMNTLPVHQECQNNKIQFINETLENGEHTGKKIKLNYGK